jgi:hypothetical protein
VFLEYTNTMINPSSYFQPNLFDFTDLATDVAELFPAIWGALEGVASAELVERQAGLDQLVELDAHRLSPLVAYVLVTRLDDANLEFRAKVVQALGSLLSPGEAASFTPDEVKKTLKAYLSRMRQRRIYALLQVAEFQPSSQTHVAALLKGCSNAGKILADIFSDRKIMNEIRRQAINFVGIVGYLEAVPRLASLAERLESGANGQRSMSFAAPTDPEDLSLLPTVQAALMVLNSP